MQVAPILVVIFLRSFSPARLKSRLSFVIEKFEMRDCDFDKTIHLLEYPTGCSIFFRIVPLQNIGGFDLDFFFTMNTPISAEGYAKLRAWFMCLKVMWCITGLAIPSLLKS